LDPATEVGRVLASEDPELPARVAKLIHGQHELAYLARAVSGTLDVDRCDYLLRDAHSTGVPYGRYDLDWLLRSLRFAPLQNAQIAPPLAIDGAKGVVSIESFILARLFMFQQVYFHKASRAAEWMIRAILSRAAGLLSDGTSLPRVPPALQAAAKGNDVSLGDYLELDDNVLFSAMHAWESGPDPILADLTRRVRGRALFKTLELYRMDSDGAHDALSVARDIAVRTGLDPNAYVGLDIAVDVPFSDRDDPLAVVFPGGVTRKPGDVSFLLGRLRDESVTRSRLIFAPELRAPIVAALGA
jgi:HD superfamily phosphohydrolase